MKVILLIICVGCLMVRPIVAGADDFREKIAPVFEAKCTRCHNDRAKKGGLDLTSASAALAGSRKGPVIVPGKPSESYLLDSISGDKPDMPRSEPPLSTEQVTAVREWIAAGAVWPVDLTLRDPSAPPEMWWERSNVRLGIASVFVVILVIGIVSFRSRSRGKVS